MENFELNRPDLTMITQKRVFNKNQYCLLPELVQIAEMFHDMTIGNPPSIIHEKSKEILIKLKELE